MNWEQEKQKKPNESVVCKIGKDQIRIAEYEFPTDAVMVQGHIAGILFTVSFPGNIESAKPFATGALRRALYDALMGLDRFDEPFAADFERRLADQLKTEAKDAE